MRLREFDEKERLLKANEKLTKYKTDAGADAAAADASGNFARGHKRFKGINAATKKQFDNDAKLAKLKDLNKQGVAEGMRKWLVIHSGSRGEGGKMIIKAPDFDTAWKLANEYDLDIIDIKPVKGVAEGAEEDMSKEAKAMATGKCPHCHGPVQKKEHPTLTQYHCAKCGIRASVDKQGVAEGSELKQAKRKYNQAAKDANADQVGAGKKIDTMKNSLRQKDLNKQGVAEQWSQKYKNSINCSHPKGFSQRAHCAGKKKHNESIEMEMVCEDCGMCQTHGSLNEIKKGEKDSNGYTRCWPGKHAEGTKTGKNGGQVRNCQPNESIEESDKSDDRCQQCGMINCKCPGDSCKCKPIAGWIPNKGFRKAAEQVDEDQLDELSKDTLRNYVRAQPARIKGPAGLATTDNKKAARIVDRDIPRAMDKYKDPEYGQQRPRLPEDSLAAMRRLAGVTTPAPAAATNGPRQYRHMPTAVQPR